MTPHGNPTHEEKVDAHLARRDARLLAEQRKLIAFHHHLTTGGREADPRCQAIAARVERYMHSRTIHAGNEQRLLVAVYEVFVAPFAQETKSAA